MKVLLLSLSFVSVFLWSALPGAQGAAPVFDTAPTTQQSVPIGKTLIIPIAATDPDGKALSFTVTSSDPKVTARVRTGNPVLKLQVSYTDQNNTEQTGEMDFLLFRDFTPLTAKLIGGFASAGFYDDLTFHRVVAGHFIQGGDPLGNGSGGPPFKFNNEFDPSLIFTGVGQLAMANAGFDSNYHATNGSQFFITLAPQRSFDFVHTIFGQIVRGMDVLEAISLTPVVPSPSQNFELSEPVNPVTITSATVVSGFSDAVLILSSTGEVTANLKLTATDADGESNVRNFTAQGVIDVFNDPPFIRDQPDVVTPIDTPVKIKADAVDLEADVRFLDNAPPANASATKTDKFFTVTPNPAASPAPAYTGPIDFAYGVYQPTSQNYDIQTTRIGVGDKKITPVVTGPFAATAEAVADFPNLAKFIDADQSGSSADFTATINWGDGSAEVPGTISADLTGGAGSKQYRVAGSHTYPQAGDYFVQVQVDGLLGARLGLPIAVSVSDEELSIEPQALTAANGKLKGATLATFADTEDGFTAADYTAQINWGDGATTPGTVVSTGAAAYEVQGDHKYVDPEQFTTTVAVSRAGATASTWSPVTASGFDGQRHLPPYPQMNLFVRIDGFIQQQDGKKNVLAAKISVFNTGTKSRAGKLRLYLSDDAVFSPDTDAKLKANGTSTDLDIPAIKPGSGLQFALVKSGATDFRVPLPKGVDSAAGKYLVAEAIYSDPIAALMPEDPTSVSQKLPPALVFHAVDGFVTTEKGGQAHIKVRLDTVPTADVTFTLTSSKTTEGTVAPASITFTPANALEFQTITATGVDDTVVDGDQPWTVVTGPFSSTDLLFNGVNPPDVNYTNKDDDH